MPTQLLSWLMSAFAFLMPLLFGQPTSKPETRMAPLVEQMPDYGVWPTEEFETDQAPLWIPTWILRPVHTVRNLLLPMDSGSKNEGIVVLYKGKIVYEWYADGWNKDRIHALNSCTKSVVSALVGIAMEDGFIHSLDDKIVDYFQDLDIAIDAELKNEITIEQMLTMTSGLPGDIDPTYPALNAMELSEAEIAAINQRFTNDSAKTFLELCSMTAVPGERWNYSSSGAHLLLGVVAHAIDRPLEDYVDEKLFGPMGITNYRWGKWGGQYDGGGGLAMTPRDMAKFGYLYLSYGRWEDARLIPADWVAQSPPASNSPFGYGRMFWNVRGLPFAGYEANGAYGQVIQIFPAYDLVIVRTGIYAMNLNITF